ncbi:MAG: YvcK family protein [Coriobacteriia bacterium]|nr:YvcK family protein [Coriobacteriia bacterium]
MADRPFALDPSNTQAFTALGAEGADDRNAHLRCVVIGGGTGAPMSIRALLSLGVTTSAVVAMADDGGSTGLMRQEARVTPPGDIRKCLAAMAANPDDPLTRAFKTRFSFARNHTLGNLMLAALEDASTGFPEAVSICERLLDCRGHVYPSTLDHVTLSARTKDGHVLDGQAIACHSQTALERVWLKPEEGAQDAIRPYGPAVRAILDADLVVLGPGSLFTSIIPNLLVPGMADAIAQSKAKVLFVCGLADVQGETWGLSAKEHLQALYAHGMEGLVDYMLVHCDHELRPENDDAAARAAADGQPTGEQVPPVRISYQDAVDIQKAGPVLLARNLCDPGSPTWHSPAALRDAIQEVMTLCRLPLR